MGGNHVHLWHFRLSKANLHWVFVRDIFGYQSPLNRVSLRVRSGANFTAISGLRGKIADHNRITAPRRRGGAAA
jgi:hypothetical protein